jgi:hypothetical protein
MFTLEDNTKAYPTILGTFLAAAVMLLLVASDGGFTLAAVIVPFAVLFCLASIFIVSRSNPFLCTVMVVALLIKFVAAWIYLRPGAQQGADVFLYDDSGMQLAPFIDHLTSIIPLQNLWGTNFIIALVAALFAFLGHSLVGVVALFTMLSFWGQYFFYRALIAAFPGADRRIGALVLFLCPSILYWTATLGKDAPMLLAIALVTFGVARRFGTTGWIAILSGIALGTIIRPHIGVFMILSLLGTYAFSDISRGRHALGKKLTLLPLMIGLCAGPLIYSFSTIGIENLEDAETMSRNSYTNNNVGGSAVGDEVPQGLRLAGAPLLLFRPLPWEINNTNAALVSLEGAIIGAWILLRRNRIVGFIRKHRSSPLVVFSIMFFTIFSIVFSVSVSNFGLLARQRVMVLPLALILLLAAGKPIQLVGWSS